MGAILDLFAFAFDNELNGSDLFMSSANCAGVVARGNKTMAGAISMKGPKAGQRRALDLEEDRAVLLAEASRVTGLSISTLKRLAKKPDGPKVFRLSSRRSAVMMSDLRTWLEGRAENLAA